MFVSSVIIDLFAAKLEVFLCTIADNQARYKPSGQMSYVDSSTEELLVTTQQGYFNVQGN